MDVPLSRTHVNNDKYFNNKGPIEFLVRGHESSYWGGFAWFRGIADYWGQYNSDYLGIPIVCDDNLWINDANSWSASIPKPGGLKIHYKVDKTDEEGDIEVEYNVKYTQKPDIKNLEFAIIPNIDEKEGPRLKFDITGLHWVKDVQLDIYVSFFENGWETILINTIKEFHGIDSTYHPYYYIAGNYYDVKNDPDTLRDYLWGNLDISRLGKPIVTVRHVITCTLLDGTTMSSELDIPVDLRDYY